MTECIHGLLPHHWPCSDCCADRAEKAEARAVELESVVEVAWALIRTSNNPELSDLYDALQAARRLDSVGVAPSFTVGGFATGGETPEPPRDVLCPSEAVQEERERCARHCEVLAHFMETGAGPLNMPGARLRQASDNIRGGQPATLWTPDMQPEPEHELPTPRCGHGAQSWTFACEECGALPDGVTIRNQRMAKPSSCKCRDPRNAHVSTCPLAQRPAEPVQRPHTWAERAAEHEWTTNDDLNADEHNGQPVVPRTNEARPLGVGPDWKPGQCTICECRPAKICLECNRDDHAAARACSETAETDVVDEWLGPLAALLRDKATNKRRDATSDDLRGRAADRVEYLAQGLEEAAYFVEQWIRDASTQTGRTGSR